jgi:hypothetical protein
MSREITFERGFLDQPREIKSEYMMRKLSIVVRSNRVNSSDVEIPNASLARDPRLGMALNEGLSISLMGIEMTYSH